MKAYESLAAVMGYPQADISGKVTACLNLLRDQYREANSRLESFEKYIISTELDSLRELYTVTFDLNPVCTLDVGYHVFGESYKRGAFLAGLQRSLREHGLEAGAELPDHLTVVLKLLARIESGEDRSALVELILVPALARMKKAFEGGDNPYAEVIRAVDLVIRQEHAIEEPEATVTQADLSFFGARFATQGCPDADPDSESGPAGCPLDGHCHGE